MWINLLEELYVEAEIKLEYANRIAEHVLKAITPDNLKVPPGLRIEAFTENETLIVRIKCERGIESLLATVNDLLACIQAVERAFKALNIQI